MGKRSAIGAVAGFRREIEARDAVPVDVRSCTAYRAVIVINVSYLSALRHIPPVRIISLPAGIRNHLPCL